MEEKSESVFRWTERYSGRLMLAHMVDRTLLFRYYGVDHSFSPPPIPSTASTASTVIIYSWDTVDYRRATVSDNSQVIIYNQPNSDIHNNDNTNNNSKRREPRNFLLYLFKCSRGGGD